MTGPQPMPWDRPAPEREGLPSAWSLFPEDLAALGCPGSALETFKRLHRPWTWKDGVPDLGSGIRRWLEGVADLRLPSIVERQASGDGSTKLALELIDGKRIESVHMPRKVRNPRVTYCISSQVGCAMGCTFCATGSMGILRNLQPGEILGQVLALMAALGPERGHELTLVFMGMGEPLHNLDHLHRAIRLMCHPAGLGLGKNRITVSTSGLVSGIEKLAKLEPRPLLALSLNATTDEARSRTMPVNRVWNLARLRKALDDWSPKRGEKFCFEYVLIAGENDSEADAQRLADWLGDLRSGHNLNLIPMNEHAASAFREPGEDRVQQFAEWLKARGCFVTVRRSRGRDVQGACGQLVKERPAPGMGASSLLRALLLAACLPALRAQAPPVPAEAGLGTYRAVEQALRGPGDGRAALTLLAQAGPAVEQDPGLLYLRALASARAGLAPAARTDLARLEAMDPGFRADLDPGFQALRLPRRARTPVGRLSVRDRLPLERLFPEGLAVDPRGDRTFLSSLLHGGVLLLERGRPPRWFLKPAPEGPWATLGLKVDPQRRLLWVASMGKPFRAGLGAGAPERAALFAADLDTGALRRKLLWTEGGRHLFNDLALGADGTVYVSDSEAGTVYRVPPDEARFEALLPPGSLPYPNGLVLSKDGAALLVAAGGPGLYRVPLAGGPAVAIRIPAGLHLQGLDGLTRAGDRLVAVQNGLGPGRVALLELDDPELALRSIRVLAAGQAELDGIPTTGDLAGTGFRFIANSQIPLLGPKGPRRKPAPFLLAEVELPQ